MVQYSINIPYPLWKGPIVILKFKWPWLVELLASIF